MANSEPRIEAVVFDMDGTLTKPFLDFDAIRADIGLPPRSPILEAMEHMNAVDRARADAVLLRHERAAAQVSELNDGALEVLAHVRAASLPVGLLTRNCHECVVLTCERHGLRFDAVVAREHAPVKPAPDGVHLLARSFGVDPSRLLVVGDYVFDIRAGRGAGAITALLTLGKDWPFANEADHVIHSLFEAIPLIDSLRRP